MINFSNSYDKLPKIFYSDSTPQPLETPRLLVFNENLARELGLELHDLDTYTLAKLFTGQIIPPSAHPISLCYAGHQFGHFNPRLGDGRAILLGEILNSQKARFDIQLKGSGKTLYSRGGDGKSWIGPVLREYIVSEAMYYLGVPTTRALAACETGEKVMREEILPGGILTRVAKSHIRIGTFEFFAGSGDYTNLQILANYTIERHYPDLINHEQKYLKLIYEVAKMQSKLVAKWMGIGFIHGVMNTDNMSISGETIDFGPCAFMDNFANDRVFSSIDRHGRYAYSRQIDIAMWNLSRFASTLIPLINEDHDKAISEIQASMNEYIHIYEKEWLEVMMKKLGFNDLKTGDDELIKSWLDYLEEEDLDFTDSYLKLTDKNLDFKQTEKYKIFFKRWSERGEANHQLMKEVNPVLIPRNHQIEHIIQSALKNDYEPFHFMLSAIQTPYENIPKFQELRMPPKPSDRIEATFCGT